MNNRFFGMGRSYKELSIIMLGIVVGIVFALLSVIFLYTMKGFDLITVSFFCVFCISFNVMDNILHKSEKRRKVHICNKKRVDDYLQWSDRRHIVCCCW